MGKASRNKHLKRHQDGKDDKYGGVKLSDALIKLCEPFMIKNITQRQHKSLLSIAAIAWNIISHPLEQRQELLLDAIKASPQLKKSLEHDLEEAMTPGNPEKMPDFIVMMQLLNALVARKNELYPNDDRIIMDYSIKSNTEGNRLDVVSIIPD